MSVPTRLETIDSEAPTVEGSTPPVWDSETGSTGDQAMTGGATATDYASTATMSSETMSSLDQQEWLPPTPAVQFYSSHPPSHRTSSSGRAQHTDHHQQQQHVQSSMTSQHSSSSSLSSMAAALISGTGPGMMQFQRAFAGSGGHIPYSGTGTAGAESPITPTATIGNGNENLLLPTGSEQMEDATRRMSEGNSMGPPEPRPPTWPTPGGDAFAPRAMIAPLLPQPSTTTAGMAPPPTTQSVYPPLTAGLAHHQHHQLAYVAAANAATILQQQQQPVVETEEKRAKRLERNRQSARNSRRRKREKLESLGRRVSNLHHEIEVARCRHINAMVPALQHNRTTEITRLQTTHDFEKLAEIVCNCGPSSRIMRTVLDFQYTQLKQLTLPNYQKMLLWLTLRDEKYFFAGKSHHAMFSTDSRANGKISSKQIGDEICNGVGGKKTKKSPKVKREEDEEIKPCLSSAASDAARTWPLLCFELKLSVDQEERFLHAHKQLKFQSDLQEKRQQMATAVHTAENFGKAVGSLSHVIAKREQKTLMGTLDPRQVVAYQAWLNRDGNRLRGRPALRKHSEEESPRTIERSKEASLADICKRLNEVLKISTKED